MRPVILLAILQTILSAAPASAQGQADLARQVQAILQNNCYVCHGKGGTAEGGFNFGADLAALVARGKVKPGRPDESRLFKRLRSDMPPDEDDNGKPITQRPSKEDVALVRRWIEAGAPPAGAPPSTRFIADADVLKAIADDLNQLEPRDRVFTRYFTLTHLFNAQRSDDEIQTYRAGLSKLVNSLSWGRRIVVPRPVDAAKTVFRIDLRDFRWDAKTWSAVLAENPYAVVSDAPAARSIQALTDCELPFVRADWFVFAASRPPLYHDLLQLPKTDRELENDLKVDVAADIRQERVARAAFNGSNVSRNNRLIERHESTYGAYWKSYDFAGNVGRQNLFERPLGPGASEREFRHDGGEIIFNLPNGLQAYMLIDGKGTRIDRGPINIVSDPKQPDRAVVNGVSCMSCHAKGMIEKADQVRGPIERNRSAFDRSEVEKILALYPPPAKFDGLLKEDRERFAAAVQKTGAHLSATEPVAALASLFEQPLDLALAAAEAGLKSEEFRAKLAGSKLARVLGPLTVDGGTVQRQVFVEAFPEVVRQMRRDARSVYRWKGLLTAHTDQVRCVAFSPDGKTLASCGDCTVKLWDFVSGRERATLTGHTVAVQSVAFSPDGKTLASGSYDHTIKMWDVATGKELATLKGHTNIVGCVAFSPDGKTLASVGVGETVKLWDVAAGKERASFTADTYGTYCVCFSPDGKTLVSVGSDVNTVKLWDAVTGQPRASLKGQTGDLGSTCFSPDGKNLALSCGNDRSARLWDAATGQEGTSFKGHTNVVRSVVFSPDGKTLASCGDDKTVKLWEIATGQERATLKGHTSIVWSVVFSPDGKTLASGSADKTIKLWDTQTGQELK